MKQGISHRTVASECSKAFDLTVTPVTLGNQGHYTEQWYYGTLKIMKKPRRAKFYIFIIIFYDKYHYKNYTENSKLFCIVSMNIILYVDSSLI